VKLSGVKPDSLEPASA